MNLTITDLLQAGLGHFETFVQFSPRSQEEQVYERLFPPTLNTGNFVIDMKNKESN